ncbi:hypothetical protein D3C83_93520 [compost metagenome]
MKTVPDDQVGDVDCVVICTDHRVFDYAGMPGRFPLIVDTRNALKGHDADHVFRL